MQERRNFLKRPSVANIDEVAIVIANPPCPDYFLIDKIISVCELNGISCLIIVNKTDLGDDTYKRVESEYKGINTDVFSISAKTGENVAKLKERLKDRLVVLVGQSAVGKTSLINILFGTNNKVGQLSEKTGKGKQTTTVSEIISNGVFKVIDTPGFSAFDLDIASNELANSYREFFEFSSGCKFRGCSHTTEPNCEVLSAVKNGLLNKDRYLRYLEIYKQQKEKEKNGKKH